MTSTRGNNVCRTCLSTEGELVSLFSETCDASGITKKIMSISNAPIEKEDGLPDKICRKCIYLLDSFYCFKDQLISSEKRLRNVCADKAEKKGSVFGKELTPSQNEETIRDELDYDIKWISEEVRIEVEKAFRRKWAKEDKKKLRETRTALKRTETQVSLLRKDLWNKTIKSEKSADIIKDDIVKTKKSKDIKNNIAKCEDPKNVIEGDVHESEKPKDIIEDNIDKTKEPKDIKDKIVKSEEPKHIKDNILKPEESEGIEDNAFKSEDPEVSMEDEPINSQNHYAVQQESLQNEEVSELLRSDKSNDGSTNEAKEKEEVIVISDSSDEADSSERPRAVLTAVSMDSLGAIGNGAYTISIVTPTYPNGRKIITIPRVVPHLQNIAGFEKKRESPSREAANVEKTSSSPRRFFQCTRCNVNLYTVAAVLLHHNQVHTPNKASLCCRMCDKTFPAKSNLFAHFNQHIESHLFRCSLCSNEFIMKKNLVEHMKTHKKRVGLAENKSASKRVRVGSANFVVSSEAGQRANKRHGSLTARKDSEDSGKENIETADPRVPLAEDLNKNPAKEAEEEDDVAAVEPAAQIVQNADEQRMEQEEELTGNDNQMVIDSETSVVENPDNFVVDQ